MNTWQTLDIERGDDDVVWVRLDTPSSQVNILTGQVVQDIHGCLESLRGTGVRALVFASAKPRSFINGAQLMLASAVQEAESIFALTEPLRRTYRAVADFEAPTIAAVHGSCFGCGVEFSLCFDYRIAADGANTTFYMTEVADYLDSPAFGSTQRLPRLIGLQGAINFLLWGHRFWGAHAARAGLIDEVADATSFQSDVDAFVERVLAGGVEPRERVRDSEAAIADIVEATRAHIRRLPEAYQPVFDGCVELMVRSATKAGPLEQADFDAETRLAGQTLVEPAAQAARSFLYLRQLAERVWVRRLPQTRQLSVIAPPRDAQVAPFVDELRRRRLPGVEFTGPEQTAPAGHVRIWMVGADTPATQRVHPPNRVAVHAGPAGTTPHWSAPVIAYRPFSHVGIDRCETRVPSTGTRPLIELALKSREAPLVATLVEWLDAAGFTVVVSMPNDSFVADDFFAAFVAPLVAFVATGGAPGEVHGALSRFGFVPSPLEWLEPEADHAALIAQIERRLPDALQAGAAHALAALLGAHAGDDDVVEHPRLIDAVLVGLLAQARRTLREGELRHPSLVDVVCRELLAFPVGLASLGQYATVERMRAALEYAPTLGAWVADADLREVGAYVEEGRNFYI